MDYQIEGRSPSEVERMLSELLGKERDTVELVADNESSQLTVIGPASVQKLAAQLIDQLNKSAPKTTSKPPAADLLASPALSDYSAIVKSNFFGVGLNAADPMKRTMITAITFSDGKPQIWITEELTNRTIRAGLNEPFTTVALTGQIVKVNDTTVVIESSGEHFLFSIGKPFSEAVPFDPDQG